MRVLHLIQGPGDSLGSGRATFANLVACAVRIDSTRNDQHRVVLLGDATARDQAARAGLRADRVLHPAFDAPILAWSGLRRERSWQADIIEIWTPELEPVARLVLGPWQARATGVARVVGPDAMPWLLAPPRRDRVGCLSHDADRDQAGRAALGALSNEPVIVLLADPPCKGDARQFAFTLGVVEVGIGPVVALMSAGSVQIVRGRSLHRLAVRRSALHVVRGSVVPHLPGADVAVVHGARSHASAWASRHALNLGLTLVGPAWLEAEFPSAAGSRVLITDGRMRSLLPAMLKAIEASRSSARRHEQATSGPAYLAVHA